MTSANPMQVAPVLAFVEALCGQMGSRSAYRAAEVLDRVSGDLSRIGSILDDDGGVSVREWAE